MLRRIQNIKNYVQPKYIKYNFVKVLINYSNESTINDLSFKREEIDDIIEINKLNDLVKKYGRDFNSEYWDEQLKKNSNLIEQSFDDSNKKYKDDILNDIFENTYYESSFHYWNITNIVRKYQLSSFDIFYSLIKDSKPFMMGKVGYEKDLMDYDKIKKEFFKNVKSDSYDGYVNYDYWNGIAIKNSFPVDVNKNTLNLRMEKYNDRNNYTGYTKIINTLISNFDKRTNDFNRYEPEIIINNDMTTDSFCGYKPSQRINFNLDNSFDSNFHDIIVNQKKQNIWNHRNTFDKNISWMYQTVPIYEKYIKNNDPNSYNLSNYFDFSRNLISKGSIKNLSIVMMLIYGKTNVDFRMLERLLNFVRYAEYSDNTYNYFQLDNFVLRYYIYSMSEKRYEISWREDNINDLKFARTDYEKMRVAKNLIQLMNEIEPQHLNFENYFNVAEWYRDNDLSIQTLDIQINNEIGRIKSEKALF